MKKLLLPLFSALLLLVSCGESENEKLDKIEKATAKILVTYNDALSKHQTNVNEVLNGSRLFGLSNSEIGMLRGSDWQQKGWDTLRVYYKIDSLETSFKTTYGEDEFNVLRLKIDSNWDEKTK